MAERMGKEIARRAPYVDIIAGARSFGDILDLAAAARNGTGAVVSVGHDRPPPSRDVTVRQDKYRAFIAVSRGCDHHCTFCIVPETRGREKGRPLAEIVDRGRGAGGRRRQVEVTLLGPEHRLVRQGPPGRRGPAPPAARLPRGRWASSACAS